MNNTDTKLHKIEKAKKRKTTLLKKKGNNKGKVVKGKVVKGKGKVNNVKKKSRHIKHKSSKTKKKNNNSIKKKKSDKRKSDKRKSDKRKLKKKAILKGGKEEESDICSRDINDLLSTTKKIYTYNNSGADGKDFTAQASALGDSSSKGWGSNPGPPPDPSKCIIC